MRRLAAVQPPPTQYVDRDGVSIAYLVVGDGPVYVFMSSGNVSYLDLQWTDPRISRFPACLASFARLNVGHLPTLAERVADLEVVRHAADSEYWAGVSRGSSASATVTDIRLCDAALQQRVFRQLGADREGPSKPTL